MTLSSVTQLERLLIDLNSTRPKRQFGSSLRSLNSISCNLKSHLTQLLTLQSLYDSSVHFLLTPSGFKLKPSANKETTTLRNQLACCKLQNGIWLHWKLRTSQEITAAIIRDVEAVEGDEATDKKATIDKDKETRGDC